MSSSSDSYNSKQIRMLLQVRKIQKLTLNVGSWTTLPLSSSSRKRSVFMSWTSALKLLSEKINSCLYINPGKLRGKIYHILLIIKRWVYGSYFLLFNLITDLYIVSLSQSIIIIIFLSNGLNIWINIHLLRQILLILLNLFTMIEQCLLDLRVTLGSATIFSTKCLAKLTKQ